MSLKVPPFRYRQAGVAQIYGLAPAAWYRYGLGITSSGGAVSQWNDQSGNGRHLLQATATNQPALQADNSILFDGVDNYLKASAFTLNQPETIYFLGKQVTWTDTDSVFDGDSTNGGRLRQLTTTPSVGLNAGSNAATNGNWTLDTYAAVCSVFNGASSLIQVGSATPTTGNPGAGNMGGFTLGAAGSGVSLFGHIQAKEVIIFPTAHDATTRARVISYLNSVGGL